MKGRKSHQIVVRRAAHSRKPRASRRRGRRPAVGDGAGILIQIPHEFLADECKKLGFTLPEPDHYAAGHCFMPQDERLRAHCENVWARILREEGLQLLGWRSVPVDSSSLSELVMATEPVHRQIFIARPKGMSQDEFERRLYLARKVVSNAIHNAYKGRDIGHYMVSLSSRTLVYKGMFLSYQVKAYYKDLSDPRCISALALVHQRFSTNTFPSWKLAHPYRMVAHNGEINTLRGNVNWMAARQASVSSPLYGDDISKLWPISYEGQSDTACFDNALEFLVMGGYSPVARRDDADPRGVGRQSADGCQPPRLLRISRLPHGAVGRPGRDGLHRRPPDRRHARPQRLAPGALSRDQGRHRDHVVGSRRAAGSRREHRPEVAAAARQDAADRPGEGLHRLRRGAEGASCRRSTPTRRWVKRTQIMVSDLPLPEEGRPKKIERVAARSAAGVRLLAGKPASS